MMKIALAVQLKEDSFKEKLHTAAELGFSSVQVSLWDMSYLNREGAMTIKRLLEDHHLEITELWCGWHKPACWDLRDGPATLGLVPTEYRSTRLQNLLDAVEVAKVLGVTDIVTHLGFIPASPTDPDYVGVMLALRHLLDIYASKELWFSAETGQETPTVLRRLIEDVGRENFGVNYDPANLLMYGNSGAVEGLPLLKPYIRSIHIKDGFSPAGGYLLGCEAEPWCGAVDFPNFLPAVLTKDFTGTLVIENEMKGDTQQRLDSIVRTKARLEAYLVSQKE